MGEGDSGPATELPDEPLSGPRHRARKSMKKNHLAPIQDSRATEAKGEALFSSLPPVWTAGFMRRQNKQTLPEMTSWKTPPCRLLARGLQTQVLRDAFFLQLAHRLAETAPISGPLPPSYSPPNGQRSAKEPACLCRTS